MSETDEMGSKDQVAAVLEELRSKITDQAKLAEVEQAIRSLQTGEIYRGTDDEGNPFRVEANAEGYLFETDEDAA